MELLLWKNSMEHSERDLAKPVIELRRATVANYKTRNRTEREYRKIAIY